MKNTISLKSRKINTLMVVFAILCTMNLSAGTPPAGFSATPPAGVSTPGGNRTGTDSIPLDGGLSILLAGALAFGVKKLRRS